MEKIRKMKLYRLVQNSLTAEQSYTAFESLYYSLGYTSFTGEINRGVANQYPKGTFSEEGKFFFMFPEHALEYMREFPLFNDYCKFIEYEVPEDIVYDKIGVGEYGASSVFDEEFDFPKAETYISKSLFGETVKASKVLTKEEKIKAYLEETKQGLKTFQIYADVIGVKPPVLEKFGCDRLVDIPDDMLLDCLSDSNSYKAFLKDNSEIAKSGFITGRSMIVQRSPRMMEDDVNEANRIILANSCFDFDYTCGIFHNFRDPRYEYARLIEQGKYEEAKEFMRRIYKRKSNKDSRYKYVYAIRKERVQK